MTLITPMQGPPPPAAPPAAPFNPFSDLTPSLGPFAQVLDTPLKMVLALLWAVMFFVCAYYLVVGIGSLASAYHRHRGDGVEAAKSSLVWPAISIIMLSAVPLIFTALA